MSVLKKKRYFDARFTDIHEAAKNVITFLYYVAVHRVNQVLGNMAKHDVVLMELTGRKVDNVSVTSVFAFAIMMLPMLYTALKQVEFFCVFHNYIASRTSQRHSLIFLGKRLWRCILKISIIKLMTDICFCGTEGIHSIEFHAKNAICLLMTGLCWGVLQYHLMYMVKSLHASIFVCVILLFLGPGIPVDVIRDTLIPITGNGILRQLSAKMLLLILTYSIASRRPPIVSFRNN